MRDYLRGHLENRRSRKRRARATRCSTFASWVKILRLLVRAEEKDLRVNSKASRGSPRSQDIKSARSTRDWSGRREKLSRKSVRDTCPLGREEEGTSRDTGRRRASDRVCELMTTEGSSPSMEVCARARTSALRSHRRAPSDGQ
jgi:hypothetical protein